MAIHVVLDNYATHKYIQSTGLAGAPSALDFPLLTPTSASWLNAVVNFFSKMTRQRIRRGVFRSIADLQAAINAYLAEHNANPQPFLWTQSADAVIAKLDRLPIILRDASSWAENLVGRDGGIRKTSLISLTSEDRRTRPHMG